MSPVSGQLMAVARDVFALHGYDATSLDEIALQAGVSKPIIYEHFGAKEGLYAAIVEREMDRLEGRITAALAAGSAREQFESAVLAFLTYAEQEPAGFAVLTRDAPAANARRGLTRVIDELAQRVGETFQREFARAGYDPQVAPIYANALIGMVTQVGQWWVAEGRPFSIDHVAKHVTALGWMGLRHLPTQPASPKPPTRRTKRKPEP